MSAQLAFVFPITATFEEVTAAVALHFGGQPVNLSTGEEAALRDPSAVFTGLSTSNQTISTGASIATAVPTLELDSEGLPWDERIHSSTKAKNEDGKWKLRKGMGNSSQLPAIKAELRQRVAASGAVQPGNAAMAPSAEQSNLHNQTDAAVAARLNYAHEQAIIAVGPNNYLTNDQFMTLKRGQSVEVPQAGLEWFNRYQQAFNSAYAAYAAGTLATTEASLAGTVHMNAQAINPAAQPGIVQLSGPVGGAPASVSGPNASPVDVPAAPAPVVPIVDFAGFAVKYAATNPTVLNEVLTPLGIAGGLAGLAAAPAMIPAVVAMLQARGL